MLRHFVVFMSYISDRENNGLCVCFFYWNCYGYGISPTKSYNI